jgi:Arc/MetJ-type ribon-helix-helix transcriptional regulator
MSKALAGRAKLVSVLLPDALVEGIDNVAAAEYSDRSAIIRSAVKTYLINYVGDELTESDKIELQNRAAQRKKYIPYERARERLGLIDSPKSRKRTR